MGLYDTSLIKIFPDREWMSHGEREFFKRLRGRDGLSVFRCTKCKVCKEEIPKPKLYCSQRCYQVASKEEEDGE